MLSEPFLWDIPIKAVILKNATTCFEACSFFSS